MEDALNADLLQPLALPQTNRCFGITAPVMTYRTFPSL